MLADPGKKGLVLSVQLSSHGMRDTDAPTLEIERG
jgi:hypothetical protein